MNSLELILYGKRGSETSIKIIDLLLDSPYNVNQISKIIDVSYNTAKYHVKLLSDDNILKKEGNHYGALYTPTSFLKENLESYNNIKDKLIDRNKIISGVENLD